jgi:hypothetical protein
MRDTLWPTEPTRRLAAVAFWAPLLLPALTAPAFSLDLSSLWSMSAWTLLPVVLLSSSLVALHRQAMLAVVAAAMVLPIIALIAAPAVAVAIHRVTGVQFAYASLLATRVDLEWRRITDKPLRLIGGEASLADGVAFYLASRPTSLHDRNLKIAPWILDIERVRRAGFAIVCHLNDSLCLANAARRSNRTPPIEVEIVRVHRGIAGAPAKFAIVLQAPREATTDLPTSTRRLGPTGRLEPF